MSHRLPSFAELFSEAQRGEIHDAPLFGGEGSLHTGHHHLDLSVKLIGGLLKAGFEVCPVRETDAKKPDFIAKTGHQAVAVEAASRHQDREQDKLQGSVHDEMRGKGRGPEGVGRSAHHRHGAVVEISEWCTSLAVVLTGRSRTTACRRTLSAVCARSSKRRGRFRTTWQPCWSWTSTTLVDRWHRSR